MILPHYMNGVVTLRGRIKILSPRPTRADKAAVPPPGRILARFLL